MKNREKRCSNKDCQMPMDVSRLEFDFENPAMFPEFDVSLLKPNCKHLKKTKNAVNGKSFLQCAICKADLGDYKD